MEKEKTGLLAPYLHAETSGEADQKAWEVTEIALHVEPWIVYGGRAVGIDFSSLKTSYDRGCRSKVTCYHWRVNRIDSYISTLEGSNIVGRIVFVNELGTNLPNVIAVMLVFIVVGHVSLLPLVTVSVKRLIYTENRGMVVN